VVLLPILLGCLVSDAAYGPLTLTMFVLFKQWLESLVPAMLIRSLVQMLLFDSQL
jgi:hypothetical protein